MGAAKRPVLMPNPTPSPDLLAATPPAAATPPECASRAGHRGAKPPTPCSPVTKSKLWAAPPLGGTSTAWASTAVARRVQVVGGSNTRYYLHSDHLGSTSLATTTAGSLVAGSTSRYTPFGNWRTEPTANLTDRGFTGHMHNNLGSGAEDIGLVYMAARWYASALGRFISADTLIPDPANPPPAEMDRHGQME